MDKEKENVTQKSQNTKDQYESDVTQEDKEILGSKGLSMDAGDDRLLEKRNGKLDFTGKDLDVPGRDSLNNADTKNQNDEENTLYGQGAEGKDGLEAPQRANTDKSS